MGYRLSILIPSVHTRYDGIAQRVIEQLLQQYNSLSKREREQVEILIVTDTKARTIGAKRNAMLQMAQGEYVAFVDDDDSLEPTYLQQLLSATARGVDVVVFDVRVTTNGENAKVCRYSRSFTSDCNLSDSYERLPNHICCVRRELALQAGFPDEQCGEDASYAKRLLPLLRSEFSIGEVLYHYEFDTEATETQPRSPRRRKPILDLVMLSKSDSWSKRKMTQKAINSARFGAWGYDINIIVIEQVQGVEYQNARTIYCADEFAYNRFANMGLREGDAEWVMVANNDLVFHAGWLSELLAAGHEFVCPADPSNDRQNGLGSPEIGDVNGRHMSGWCFMMRRALWQAIGGLDEEFRYWCADDCVIEQTRAVGILPMVVPSSRVLHLGSRTGGTALALPSDMTWAQVYHFEQKYKRAKFVGDSRYQNWKRINGYDVA